MNKGGLGSLGLKASNNLLNDKQVLHIKKLLFFNAYQVVKLSEDMGIPVSCVININNKRSYKHVYLTFDDEQDYEKYLLLSRRYRSERALEDIDKVYDWIIKNPNAMYISLDINIQTIFKDRNRVHEDWEYKEKLLYIKEYIEKQRIRREKHISEKARFILVSYLKGYPTNIIAKVIGSKTSYVASVINGRELPSHFPEIREEVFRRKKKLEEEKILEVHRICKGFIHIRKTNPFLSYASIGKILKVSTGRLEATAKQKCYKEITSVYSEQLKDLV